MRQKDLVWVALPFSTIDRSKVRPAIIVSNDEYNSKRQDVIVCAITSKLEEKQYSIIIDNRNLISGKLPLKSRIRGDKIMQIEKNLIIKPFAQLDDKTFDALVNEIIMLVKRSRVI